MAESSKVDVVGVGLNATDTLIPVAHYPARGSKVEFRSANILPGGQVATAVVACQQWGLRTRYVGKLGDDGAAAMHRAEFARLGVEAHLDRKSTRLNSSHGYISYAVFCLKKKKNNTCA